MDSLKLYFRVLRIQQWVKNLFVFIPSFFAGTLFDENNLISLSIGFTALCFISSGIYILNDMRDEEMDKLHPVKKYRPFASQMVSKSRGWQVMIIILAAGIALSYSLNFSFFLLCLLYLSLNFGYSLGLKSIPILDLLIVSSGFIIRIYCGGVLSEVSVSHWLSIMIFLLSLFIVLAKRKDDILLFERNSQLVRKTSSSYNNEFINSCITMVAGVIIVAYILYTMSPEIKSQWGTDYLFVTTIFVIAGIMRYLQLIFVEERSGSPMNILYKDKFTILTLISWLVSFFVIIYL